MQLVRVILDAAGEGNPDLVNRHLGFQRVFPVSKQRAGGGFMNALLLS